MNLKRRLSGRLIKNLSDRLRRYGFSNVPVKIVAIVLVAVFIPSILITVLGLLAIRSAESHLRESIEYPVQDLLFELDKRLTREWDHRLQRYAGRLESEQHLHAYLLTLPKLDDHVSDVILYEKGEFRHIERESPFWRLEIDRDDPDLVKAWKLEFQEKDYPAALAAYRQILRRGEPETEVAALSGMARIRTDLDWRGAIESLKRLLERYGNTVDETGHPRGHAVLWRIVSIYHENEDPASARYALQLANFLKSTRPWVDLEIQDFYRKRLSDYQRETRIDVGDFEISDIPSPRSTLVFLDESVRAELERHARDPGDGDDYNFYRLQRGDGDDTVLAYFRTGRGDRVVYLELDPLAHVLDARLFTEELGIQDQRVVVTDPRGRTLLGAVDTESEPLATRDFARPFQHLRTRYHPPADQIPRQLNHLQALLTTGFIWGVIVLVLTITLGILVTLRSILQEMQVSRMKTDFVSFVTHELKTPLTAIRMFSEMMMLKRTESREEQEKCIELIDREASRLSRLIEQILEFARIERHEQAFNFTSCDISDVVDEALKIFREEHADDNLVIEVNQAQHMSRIRMDRSSMVELILNLLSNAYKYSRGPDRKIIINLRESIDDIFVEVVDFGVGIPRAEQRKIFDRFYRAQDYLTRDVEGTGLGLTFAKYIAKVHNGDVRVSSSVDHGSTFTLELRKDQVLAE